MSSDLISSELVETSAFRISWHPSKSIVAIPSYGGSVTLVHAEDSSCTYLLPDAADDEISDKEHHVVIARFSPDGDMLASADTDGNIIVWDSNLKQPINKLPIGPNLGTIIDIAWRQDKIVILTTTSYAELAIVKPQNELTKPVETGALKLDSAIVGSNLSDPARSSGSHEVFDGENIGALKEDITRRVMRPSVDNINHGDDHIHDDKGDSDEDDEDFEDDNSYKLLSGDQIKDFIEMTKALQSQEPQSPFQPSSTTCDDKGRRYLVWNCVGNITTRDEGSLNQRIEIKFSNTAGNNKPDSFPDNYGFQIAALSYEGAFFANCPNIEDELAIEDNRPGSTIYYHAFTNQRQLEANESFTYTLGNNEKALAVAVGKGWAAVATSKQYVRLFSSTGLQLSICYLKGSVITMVGSGSRLAIFYLNGFVLNGPTQISVEIYEFKDNSTTNFIANVSVPLPSRTTLTWAGFEVETGSLVFMNSDGVLSMLLKTMGWQWIPILDTALIRKAPDVIYWPISVKANRLVYVLLNGESKPAIYPQPVASNKPFLMPIVEAKEGKDRGNSQNERTREFMWSLARADHLEGLRQDSSVSSDVSDLEYIHQQSYGQRYETDKTILKMMQEALASQRHAAAADLAGRLSTEKAIGVGIAVANHFGRIQLAKSLERSLTQKSMISETIVSSNVPAEHYKLSTELPACKNSDKPFNQGDQEVNENAARSNSEIPILKKPLVQADQKAVVAQNPFMRTNVMSPQPKRKSVFEDIKELKGSPSPKRPLLSVS